jgi:hypothetical protein
MEPNNETQSQESNVEEECKDEYGDSEESSVECDNELTTEEIEVSMIRKYRLFRYLLCLILYVGKN